MRWVEFDPHRLLIYYNWAAILEEIGETNDPRDFFDNAYSRDTDDKLKKGDF